MVMIVNNGASADLADDDRLWCPAVHSALHQLPVQGNKKRYITKPPGIDPDADDNYVSVYLSAGALQQRRGEGPSPVQRT